MDKSVSLGSVLAIVTTLIAAGGVVGTVIHYLDGMNAAITALQAQVSSIEKDLSVQKHLSER